MLTFSKYLVFEKEFDFSNDDMPCMREKIRKELSDSKIYCHFEAISVKKVRKRTALDKEVCLAPTKLSKFRTQVDCSQRRFLNEDNEVLL